MATGFDLQYKQYGDEYVNLKAEDPTCMEGFLIGQVTHTVELHYFDSCISQTWVPKKCVSGIEEIMTYQSSS